MCSLFFISLAKYSATCRMFCYISFFSCLLAPRSVYTNASLVTTIGGSLFVSPALGFLCQGLIFCPNRYVGMGVSDALSFGHSCNHRLASATWKKSVAGAVGQREGKPESGRRSLPIRADYHRQCPSRCELKIFVFLFLLFRVPQIWGALDAIIPWTSPSFSHPLWISRKKSWMKRKGRRQKKDHKGWAFSRAFDLAIWILACGLHVNSFFLMCIIY